MSNNKSCYPARHEWDFNTQTRESEEMSFNWTDIKCKNCDYVKRVWVKDTTKLQQIPLASHYFSESKNDWVN